jgi:hypothetical protein
VGLRHDPPNAHDGDLAVLVRYIIPLRRRTAAVLERFRAKWIPVRVKKTRQNKRLEPGSDSIRTDKALDAPELSWSHNTATEP